ncbi:MFS transporter [Donghicola sp. C2-DW-16]|uniref:MFS transporter n=1 Tax=Donghicola mangrovi TaxID=2729614 RepID=A0ABX2P961_9RHOB|nr:MFS transporter [Donghicola mangrovi]NVO25893.1 MFS transporter [Donghicola mangrovi]
MTVGNVRKRIWGWYFFDWASQPFATLLITFIFGPYIKEILKDGAQAQAVWGFGVGAAGIAIAILAPILGAMADTTGNRGRWIWGFSVMYVLGSYGLWYAHPDHFNLALVMTSFAVGMIGMEFATIFTNSMLPDLGPREEVGKISGNGWAFGYVGGLLALIIMLAFFADSPVTGKTFIGLDPVFGLDATTREGTRAVGPLTAIWYVVFMIPFFLFVRDPNAKKAPKGAIRAALHDLGRTLKGLPQHPSLSAYLASSMLYRDALNGMYVFGGIYAAGVLGWSVQQTGIFGLVSIIFGALFAWLGGKMDMRFGPRPVIVGSILALVAVSFLTVMISRDAVLFMPVAEGSKLPDLAFMFVGAVIGAAGGILQSASRTMLVRQANPARMTEAFGLYALAGKATSFIAPLSIGIVTHITGSQQIGVSPLIVLFLAGLFLIRFVAKDGDPQAWSNAS